MFRKVLVANRGEIALRILRTLREMGITGVAVYSDADREARFVLEADEAYRIGPPAAGESYLNQPALIEAARKAGADAIHPGYGFLSENADFAQVVEDAGLTFIGPTPESMRRMGDKIAARRTAAEAGVPLVPGTNGAISSLDEALLFLRTHGLPVLVKAGGGGGGRGIRVVEREQDLQSYLAAASREAATFFNNPDVYLERFYNNARHIEVQVAGDRNGDVIAWGERDCSTQRRRQKLIEETPAPGLSSDDRSALLSSAERLAASVNYVGVGTVEFLYAGPGQYFFLEMNTRIQVEHTITEAVTGLDLVRESINLAAGEAVTRDVVSRGHAIEARINAEDPAQNFQPGPGVLSGYREPGGQGVRVDSGVYQGFAIPGDYDSLIAKLIVHAPNREQAVSKMLRALGEYRIEGVPSTVSLIHNIVDSRDFRAGGVTTDWLDAHLTEMVGEPQSRPQPVEPSPAPKLVQVEVNGKRFDVRLFEAEPQITKAVGPRSGHTRSGRRNQQASANHVVSPMRGTILVITKVAGELVEEGERLAVVEAMKMENEVRAPRAGRIASVLVAVGDTVESRQPLIELEP